MSAPTSTVTAPTGTRRLLADAPDVPVPHLDVEGSSLTEVHRQLRRPVAEREDELV